MMRPRSFFTGKIATSGFGPDVTVLTRGRVAMRSPSASSAMSAAAPVSRVLKRISTPRFISRVCANSANDLGSSGRISPPACRHHPDLVRTHGAEAAGGGPNEVVQLGHRLHAREAATGHHERQERAAHGRVLLDVGLLQDVDEAVAQSQRVAKVL